MRLTKYYVAPLLFGAMVVVLGLTLLVIGARSPYTHSNRAVGPDPAYSRTRQTLVGPPLPNQRSSIVVEPHADLLVRALGAAERTGEHSAIQADLLAQGATLYFELECASCHGLTGRGGIYAPPIAGRDVQMLARKTSEGPGGMPQVAGLTNQDLQALAAYLQPAAAVATTGVASSSATPAATATPAVTSPATAPPAVTPPAVTAPAVTPPATGSTPSAAPAQPAVVAVNMTEFAFAIDRDTVPAGQVQFTAKNSGFIQHNMVVFKTDVDPDKLTVKDEAVDETLYASPGRVDVINARGTNTATLQLTSGKYVLVCNIISHYTGGMYSPFTVK